MIKAIFSFNGEETIVECKINDNIKKTFIKSYSKTDININDINFVYNGRIINEDLTFEKLEYFINDKDKINIIVYGKNNKKNIEKKDNIHKNFKKNPNLKYKLDINKTNDNFGINDLFEVFKSSKDNIAYIVSKNIDNYNLDIFRLLDNKKIISLEGHKNTIISIRYFINNENNNEYLISSDYDNKVIIWDITNNYQTMHIIYESDLSLIFSCILIFPHYNNDNYIVISSKYLYTKLYLLNNGKFIKDINMKKSNYYEVIKIYYLLSWYNKNNNNYYIIELANNKIIIIDLFEKEQLIELKHGSEGEHYSGFIYSYNNNDYLCSSSTNGFINIWDLYNKKIFKSIYIKESYLYYTIHWNNKYIIVADGDNISFKIIDIEKKRIVSDIRGPNKDIIKCIKKVEHPIFGESLLSSGNDQTIKLWTIN